MPHGTPTPQLRRKTQSDHVSHPKSYFVDEAGDLNIYDNKGNVTIGTPGVSQFFMIGFVDIENPLEIAAGLDALHRSILSNPQFEHIPSLRPAERKTALGFHAKDDAKPIRNLVYDFIAQQHGLRFFAVVREKSHVARDYTNRGKHYSGNMLYDDLVSRLFKEHLHKANGYDIIFASRGKTDRANALRAALMKAREHAKASWGVESEAPINIQALPSHLNAGLQIADYCLWAVQRLFERGDEEFIRKIEPLISKIHDIDDRRKAGYGVYYGKNNRISAARIARNT